MSFRLRGDEESPAFRFVYPGVLRDLELEDDAVEQYIAGEPRGGGEGRTRLQPAAPSR